MNTRPLFRHTSGVLFLALAAFVSISSCDNGIAPDNDGNQGTGDDIQTEESYDPFVITDGKVRFYFRDGSILNAYGAGITDWKDYTVEVNNATYSVNVNEEGKAYIDVPFSNTSAVYNAVVTKSTSAPYHGQTKYDGLIRPHAYIYHKAKEMISSYPMYASYSQETGGTLKFTNGMSLLRLKVKGNGEKVASIKIDNLGAGFVAGQGAYSPSSGLALSKGVYFAVLNTTNSGEFVQLTPDGTEFLIPVPSRNYTQGFEITLCTSDHKMSKSRTGSFYAAPDMAWDYEFEHRPDADLLFYEGFDNFVWGGDIVGGSATFGLNISTASGGVTTSTGRLWKGYDDAVLPVSYDMPGIGYVQSTSFANIQNKTVGTAHFLQDSYIKSRNIADYLYMYRCQEYQGYISVGDDTYGVFEAPFATMITPTHQDVRVTFKYCPKAGFNNPIKITATCGANIVKCSVNGAEAKVSRNFKIINSECVISSDAVTIPTDMSVHKMWNTVELTVKNLNNKSALQITNQSTASGNVSTFYLDEFCVRRIADHTSHSDKLRVLYWNIQYGMWADQAANYDNFVRFIKKYDPDICVWCESESYYNDAGTAESYTNERGYLPKNWATLANRYGHGYIDRAKNKNNFSQTITSKYPIETVYEINGSTSQPLTHGAGLFRVKYGSKNVYVLSIHLKPDQTADVDRKKEIDYLCNEIINDATVKQNNDNLTNLLMMGDFNAVSPADKTYYESLGNKNVVTSDNYLPLDHLASRTNLVDVIAAQYPGDFYSSIHADNRRIDFMFASPAMYQTVKCATFIVDDWTILAQDKNATANTYLCRPSDHRPLIVDFQL